VSQQISPPVEFTVYSTFIFKNQPLFDYYNINMMSVHQCTPFSLKRIQDLTPADCSFQFELSQLKQDGRCPASAL